MFDLRGYSKSGDRLNWIPTHFYNSLHGLRLQYPLYFWKVYDTIESVYTSVFNTGCT